MIFDVRKHYLLIVFTVLLMLAATMLGRAQNNIYARSYRTNCPPGHLAVYAGINKYCLTPKDVSNLGWETVPDGTFLQEQKLAQSLTLNASAQSEVMSVTAEGNLQVCKWDAVTLSVSDCHPYTGSYVKSLASWLKAEPAKPDNKPLRTDEYRALVEQRYQAEYEKLVPGIKVHLYARGDQYLLLFKVTGRPDIVYSMNVEDIDNPTTLWKGFIHRVDSARPRKKSIRR